MVSEQTLGVLTLLGRYGGAEPVFDTATPVIRYMKLSSFLLLLAGKVFIPSIEALQASDRFESRVPRGVLGPDYQDLVWPIIESVKDWLLRYSQGADVWAYRLANQGWGVQGDARRESMRDLLVDMWLKQISKRRCAWCWNREFAESHALWRLYGDKGVAIVSTVGKIAAALKLPDDCKGSVSPVRYVNRTTPSDPSIEAFDAETVMKDSTFLRRPYFFKELGYRYENEVRFVFATKESVISFQHGALIDIDPAALIVDVLISPHIPESERTVVKNLIDLISRSGSGLQLQYTEREVEQLLRVLGHPFSRDSDVPEPLLFV
jgi:hypothetical protein